MKTLVAIPCGDQCSTDFVRSLMGMQIEGEVQFTFAQGSLVYDARNQLVNIAIDQGFERVLWLDSDMVFNRDLFKRLSADLDEGRDIVSALCFTRKRPIRPAAWKAVYVDSEGVPHADCIEEWADEIFEVEACGFAVVMCKVDMLKAMREKFGLLFSPITGFGEDLSFCLRARDMGYKIHVDPRPKIGHVGLAIFGEEAYKLEVLHRETK